MANFEFNETCKFKKIFFVQDGATCSHEMKNAFSVCQEAKFNPTIIPEDSVQNGIEISSDAVFVLERFCGEIFNFLSSKDCLVVGPCCISSCITEKIPIPHNGMPVFSISLRGRVICTTGLNGNEKNELKNIAGYMGAIFSDDLTLAVTHLIAKSITSIRSGKCVKAVENNIPIIGPDWIKKCWEVTQLGSNALDPLDFKLKSFQGMHISCSNLSMSEKKKLQTLIEANGGVYQRTLELNKTNVLVIRDPEGKKWHFAQQWEIPCVSPSWIYECAEKGCIVLPNNHLVLARPKCSTPTHSVENNSFMSCSDISVVPLTSERNNIDETNSSIGSEFSVQSLRPYPRNKVSNISADNAYRKVLEEISLNDLKGAGLFLDGCKIFLSGFTPLECEKLKKIINSGGATLYTSISDCLSHIVVGEFSVNNAKEFSSLVPRPHIVKLEWLVKCLKEKSTVGVEPFLCLQSAPLPPASPLSHKGLQLLKSHNGLDATSTTTPTNESRAQVSRKLFVKASVVKPSPGSSMDANTIDITALERRALEEINKEKDEQLKKEQEMERIRKEKEEMQRQKEIEEAKQQMEKLSDQSKCSKNEQSKDMTTIDADQSTIDPFFQGLWFDILGYDEIQQIQESIEQVGGKLISRSSDPSPDYAIVPVEGTNIKTCAKNIVSIIFVEDCYDQGTLIKELDYYHKPLPGLLNTEKKLEGTVFAFSGFSRAERRLLNYVASNLGAFVQDMFSRADHPDKGVRKSTHLVCKEMSGKKYEAALKWGIPVVDASWLLKLVEPDKTSNVSTSETRTQELEKDSIADEINTTQPNEATQPLQNNTPEPPLDITPINQILRRLSVPGSAGTPPFHIKTPETPYGQALTDGTPSPETRKRWKRWIENFPNLYEGSPLEPAKAKRPSTPMDVIRKQLWVKFGGVSFDGIEPETGKLLPNGPFGEWANKSDTEDGQTNKSLGGDVDDVVAEFQRRLSEVKPSQAEDEQKCTQSINEMEDLSPSMRRRLSNRIEVSQNTSEPPKKWEENVADMNAHEEGNRPVLWDFNPVHSSTVRQDTDTKDAFPKPFNVNSTKSLSASFKNMEETPKENVPSNPMKRPSDPSKSSIYENSTKIEASNFAPSPVPKKVPRLSEGHNIVTVDMSLQVFLLSGLAIPAKQKYEGIIRQLGGGLTLAATYDPSTTHIIVEKPIRSEKLLCCIASGKWVLHASYLDSCYEARKFLPEEEFEWGNPIASSRLPKLKPGSTEAGLANAGYKWRQRKRDMGSATPFREMKVILFTPDNKQPQYRRLLEAGGATILDRSDIFKATHVIWEEGKVEIPVPLTELASRKIHVVPPVYMGEFLVKAPPPSEFYPASYAKVVRERRKIS